MLIQALGTSRRTRAVVVVLGLATTMMVLLWTTGLASAHGGDSSKVHACMVPESGTIRIVEPGHSCHKNETALDWTRNAGAVYIAGSGLALSANNEFSVTGAPWSGLTGVPSGFADGVDNDGSSQVLQLRSDLLASSNVISGHSVVAGSITAAKLAGEYRDHDFDPSTPPVQWVPGAVTSEKILDGTVAARDLDPDLVQRLEALEAKVTSLETEVAALKAG